MQVFSCLVAVGTLMMLLLLSQVNRAGFIGPLTGTVNYYLVSYRVRFCEREKECYICFYHYYFHYRAFLAVLLLAYVLLPTKTGQERRTDLQYLYPQILAVLCCNFAF